MASVTNKDKTAIKPTLKTKDKTVIKLTSVSGSTRRCA